MTSLDGGAGAPRYAIYFAPPRGSAWWQFGAGWLGRDDAHGALDEDVATSSASAPFEPPRPIPPPGFAPDDWRRATAEPRRYGFHATLKAPFRLAAHASAGMLCERTASLAGALRAVPLGGLHPHRFTGFVALTPAACGPALTELAARCVADLDDLRAPLSDAEILRRRPEQLDERGRELLLRYGYPHVMERFRFHMALATCGDDALASRIAEAARHASIR